MMYAQATRTWVSGVGDDANPCSRTAPCKTWAGAISKTAAGGEIDALDPGGFGALTITKAITLDGGGGQVASTLVAGTNGIVVAAGAADVVIIRNIRINGIRGTGNGGFHGIRFINANGGSLGIENCTIFGFNNNGIDIEPPAATTATVWITRTTVANNGGFGVLAGGAGTAKVTVFDSTATGNSFGFVAQPTAGGTAELDIHNSTASNNSNTGFFSGGGGGTGTVRLNGNSIFNNAVAGTFAAGGSTVVTYGNNSIIGAGVLTLAAPPLQ